VCVCVCVCVHARANAQFEHPFWFLIFQHRPTAYGGSFQEGEQLVFSYLVSQACVVVVVGSSIVGGRTRLPEANNLLLWIKCVQKIVSVCIPALLVLR
jgi:hypothetical protein